MRVYLGRAWSVAPKRIAVAACLAYLLVVGEPILWGQDLEEVLAAGKAAFSREWSSVPAGTATPLGGDGLGPVFNAGSCVACHSQGGMGGGGPLDKNVDMLSLPADGLELTVEQGRKLRHLHPSFMSSEGNLTSSVVLHKFSVDEDYALARRQLMGEDPVSAPHSLWLERAQQRLAKSPIRTFDTGFGLKLYHSQRNTTALFGAGLIDQISDSVLTSLELAQPQRFPGITGRAAPAPGGIGRFGWRARTARLAEFVAQACANEVGLQVATAPQGMLPTRPDYRLAGVDISSEEVAAMTAFVAYLSPPRPVLPAEPEPKSLVLEGRLLFDQIGCAACHMENLGGVEGLYSDLLLHDMGPRLTDPAPAEADVAFAVAPSAFSPVSASNLPNGKRLVVPNKASMASVTRTGAFTLTYYGGVLMALRVSSNSPLVKRDTSIYQEWRTPPLWGVQDSAPYLHDGRAATLVEAIQWHGGESQPSAQRFAELDAAGQQKLLGFLRTLRAPGRPGPIALP